MWSCASAAGDSLASDSNLLKAFSSEKATRCDLLHAGLFACRGFASDSSLGIVVWSITKCPCPLTHLDWKMHIFSVASVCYPFWSCTWPTKIGGPLFNETVTRITLKLHPSTLFCWWCWGTWNRLTQMLLMVDCWYNFLESSLQYILRVVSIFILWAYNLTSRI